MLRRLALLVLTLAPTAGHANIGAPSRPGEPAGEARGDFARLAILDEVIRFDLRPLAKGERALVEVHYRIRNLEAAARTFTMAFRTPGVEEGTVSLDGRRLAYHAQLAGASTSQPAGGAGASSTSQPAGGGAERELVFSASLAARGEHRIDVSYQMRPAMDTGGSLYWKHGILYDLSPARQWASFGTLDVEVLAPPGWQVESDPELARQGDRLQRRFQGLPAANLVLSARRRAEYTWGWALYVVGGLGGALAILVLAWRRGRRSASSRVPALLAGLGYGLLAAALAFLLAAGGLALWGALLDPVQSSGRELYSHSLSLIFLGVPAGVVLTITGAITYSAARRRCLA